MSHSAVLRVLARPQIARRRNRARRLQKRGPHVRPARTPPRPHRAHRRLVLLPPPLTYNSVIPSEAAPFFLCPLSGRGAAQSKALSSALRLVCYLCHPDRSSAAFPFTPYFGVPRYAVEGPLFDPPVLSITMRRRICRNGGLPAAGRVFRPAAFVLARPADSLAVLTCVVLLVLLAVGLTRQKNLQRQLEDMKQQIQRPVGQVAQPHTTAK